MFFHKLFALLNWLSFPFLKGFMRSGRFVKSCPERPNLLHRYGVAPLQAFYQKVKRQHRKAGVNGRGQRVVQ